MKIPLLFLFLAISIWASAQPEFYELRIYHLADQADEQATDQFLKDAFVPALHQQGISSVGVFKAAASDTAHKNRMYVLIPYKTMNQIDQVNTAIWKDDSFLRSGKTYLEAPHDNPPYVRMETIVLKAFKMMPKMEKPGLKGPRSSRVYELRSYEGATENLYRRKVHMFNEGKEIDLFRRLKFNAVFYAEVLAGSRMPNLMYMTTFENMADRDSHWKLFVDDPEWKTLSAKPEYEHTVSKADIFFLYPTEYSDY